MSRDPIRLEPYLTRDFVSRREKLRGLDGKWDPYISKLDTLCCWIILAGLVGWIYIAW